MRRRPTRAALPLVITGGGHAHFLDWPGGNAGVVFDLGSATWMVDAEGAALRRITDADPERAGSWPIGQYGYYADVSPDGSRVVYSTCEYTTFDHDMRLGWRYNLGYEIASVSVDGSGRQRLTDNVHFENYPTWSPDGTRIAFIAHNGYSRLADYDYYLRPDHYHVSNSEVFTRSADGSDERVVPNTRGAGLYPAVWSPDGQRLAFTAHEVPPPFHGASARLERFLYTVRLDGSELSRVGKATTLPTWSPDGEWVAYGLEDRVYSVRFDGTDLREVLDDVRANDVSWSPDGTELLLASDRGMYLVRPDGSGKRAVGPRIRTTAATWSPGGSIIAARHEPDPEDTYSPPWIFVIFTMNRDGTDVRFLARGFLEGDGYRSIPKIVPIKLPPIDPATCSNGVAVAQPEVTPGLVEDCRVLIRSRDAFGPRAASGWTTDTPMGKWPGVVVGGDPPRVRELRIRYNVVTGTIPPDIGKLTMLEVLGLYGNSLLIGAIPPELGKLTMLRSLYLNDNNLSGPIPPELGAMRSLSRLALQANELSGCVPVELRDLWVEASGLERCKP